MSLLRLCTLFILLELQHCLPTDQAEKAPEHTYYGYPGVPGTPGHNGLPGRDGREGVAGQKGEKGDTGMMGAQGPPGEFGPAGPVGPAGPAGAPGPVGPAGPKGLMGPVGQSGPKGEPGPAGPLPAINLVELQSELQTLKVVFNKSETELQTLKVVFNKSETEFQTLKDVFNKSETEFQTLKDVFNKSETELQTLKDFVNKFAAVTTRFQFTRWVGGKYFVSDKKKGTFAEAVKWCSSVGGVPALPTSMEENQALFELKSKNGISDVWLSANDRKSEGKFVDLQEKAIRFSYWDPSEPSGGQVDCVVISSDAEWYDVSCDGSWYIVCEI